MAISAHVRNTLKKSEFGLPQERKYPVDTRGRAVSAKGRATQQVEKGNLSPEEAARIKSKANAVLKENPMSTERRRSFALAGRKGR